MDVKINDVENFQNEFSVYFVLFNFMFYVSSIFS